MQDDAHDGREIRTCLITRTRRGGFVIQLCSGDGSTVHPMETFDTWASAIEYLQTCNPENL